MRDEIRSFVGVASIALATNIAYQLITSWYKRKKRHPQEIERDVSDNKALTRKKAIEIAGVQEPQKLFGVYYFLLGDLERSRSYYRKGLEM